MAEGVTDIGAGDRLRWAWDSILAKRAQAVKREVDALALQQAKDAAQKRVRRRKHTKSLTDSDEIHVIDRARNVR